MFPAISRTPRGPDEAVTRVALLEAQLNASPDGILIVDTQGRRVLQNERFRELLKIPPEIARADDNGIGQFRSVVERAKDPQRILKRVSALIGNPEATGRGRIEFADGTILESDSAPLRSEEGCFIGRVWFFRDVTARICAEGALRESNAFYHSLVEQLPAGVFRKDRDGRYVYVSPWFCRLKGLKPAHFLGKTPTEVAAEVSAMPHPTQHAIKYSLDGAGHHTSIMQSGNSVEQLEEYVDEAGHKQWMHAIKIPVVDDSGNVIATQGILFDITARKQAEEQARHLAAFPELNPNPVLEFKADATLVYHNPAAVAMVRKLGFTSVAQLLPEATADIVRLCLTRNRPSLGIETVHGKSTLEWSFYPIVTRQVVHCYVDDCTERRSLEQQLRQAQKMEAIGHLAGGVAHDFNNLLTVIIANIGLLREGQTLPRDLAEPLSDIAEAADRAANLTRQLLSFSRRQVVSAQGLDLNQVVTNVTKMLRRILGETIQLEFQPAPRPLPFCGDAGLIEQVLVNLAVNARDAMPRGGRLRILTATETRKPSGGGTEPAREATFLRLSVADSGTGIAPEHRSRIFEPFFTTKDVGKGTGLGLATVFNIVRQHRGWVEFETEMGRGTTFHVFLPSLGTAEVEPPAPTTGAVGRGRGELILLVEDETAVRETATRALQMQGYRVVTAESGRRALEIWPQLEATVDLLLTDVIMPEEITGFDLAQRILERRPKLPVIFSSGYNSELSQLKSELREGVNYLAKPYDLERLFRIVRAGIDRSAER